MSDCRFSIQELYAVKVITLNRPKQKENDQFDERHVAKNSEIAATGIHLECFMGRVLNWETLNFIWPIYRIDILSSTWQTLSYIVNLTNPPIGLKNEDLYIR